MVGQQPRRISLASNQQDVFSRQKRIENWNQDALSEGNVLIIGAGALGNECAKNLAMAGIGKITIVDDDVVEPTNLNRCIFFTREDLGEPKARVVANRLKTQFTLTNTTYIQDKAENINESLFSEPDVVVTCVDNLDTRLTVNRLCMEYDTPLVDGGTDGLVVRVQTVTPPSSVCLDCGRQDINRELTQKRYRCGESTEVFEQPMAAVSTASALAGAVQSNEVIKLLQSKNDVGGHLKSANRRLLSNTLFHMDLGSNYVATFELTPDSDCPFDH